MTEKEKMLVKKDLALCLKLNAKLGNYQNRNAVQKIYNWLEMEPRFHTAIGKRYIKRLGEVLAGKTDFMDCVLCGGFMMDGTAVCGECLQKYRGLMPQSAEQKAQTENETVNAAKDKLKGLADSGMEKLQENPTAAKAMEKGKEQAKKARGKWRGMSKKKRIVTVVVCVLLFLGAVSEMPSSGKDLIDMVGLTEEQAWKEFGKPDRRETLSGVSFGYYDDGTNYATRLNGSITAVSMTGGKSNVLGISLGDGEEAVKKAMKKEHVSLDSQDIVTEDGQQMVCQKYKKIVRNTDYIFTVYLDGDYRVKKILVTAK